MPTSRRANASSRTAAERTLQARIAANTRWSQEPDRTAATAAARAAALDRFEREVDPDGVLPAHERAVRAASARRAHFQRMALKSAQVRKRRGRVANGGDLGGVA